MKIAYAFRRCTFYPNQEAELPLESAARRTFLKKVKSLGFDGVELSAAVPEISGSREKAIQTLRDELNDAGLACAAVRSGGGLTDPRSAAGNKKGLENAVRFAAQIGAGILKYERHNGASVSSRQRCRQRRNHMSRREPRCQRRRF